MDSKQINISIAIDPSKMTELLPGDIDATIEVVQAIAHKLHEKGNQIYCEAPEQKPAKHRNEELLSRHHQSVAANTRIMDAIEFINKEMRLLKGHSENGTLKVFEEIRRILLGI